ncbi:MAG: hypothetical protein M3143_10365 [Actinomycetota bacterium]|nr:hypothetical protein [Actinomycetota bacterium]
MDRHPDHRRVTERAQRADRAASCRDANNDHLTSENGGEFEVTFPQRLTEQKSKAL